MQTQWENLGRNCDSEVTEQILEGTFDAEHQLTEVTRFFQKCKLIIEWGNSTCLWFT